MTTSISERVDENCTAVSTADDFLSFAAEIGWRKAVENLNAVKQHEVCDRRGTFLNELLPIEAGSNVLYLNSGWGNAPALLAERYRVFAHVATPIQASFLEIRKRQDGISNLVVLAGRSELDKLGTECFSAILASGPECCGEGWFCDGEQPSGHHQQCLKRLRRMLAPEGIILLTMANRASAIGPIRRRGPANRRRWPARTQRYRYSDCRRLFRSAGLTIQTAYITVYGRDRSDLVPMSRPALTYCLEQRRSWPDGRMARRFETAKRAVFASPRFWEHFASEFAFVLAPARDGSPCIP